jgi:hypothetical protein
MGSLARDRIKDSGDLLLVPARLEWATRTRFEVILLLQTLRWDLDPHRVDFLDLEAGRRATCSNPGQWDQ